MVEEPSKSEKTETESEDVPKPPHNSEVSEKSKKRSSEKKSKIEEPKQYDEPTGIIKPNNYHKEEDKF